MSQGHFPVTHTEAEWRALLTPEQYAIMREHGTERAGSCALNYEKRPGVFSCAGCGQPLFESQTKFESGTGWPSFNTPVLGAVEIFGRSQLGNEPHRGPLRPMRLASRSRLSRRPSADRLALLHQWCSDQFHAGRGMSDLSPDGEAMTWGGTGLASHLDEAPLSRAERGVPASHPPVRSGRVGVLIVNLGTPEGTDYWSMRRYLKEFLSDRRVIEAPRAIWAPILQLILLRRPSARGRDYASIWNKERDEGPLKTITRSQSEKLAAMLAGLRPEVEVDWAMRYGRPPIAERLDALKENGCDRILAVPLYPQYCAATTATVADRVFDVLKGMRWQPAIRIAAPWYDERVYIDGLARSTRAGLEKLDFKPEIVLASYHGVPQSYLAKGDPYYCHCAKTTRLLGAALGWDESRLKMTFQSRFGRAEWLKPYTAETVRELARSGVKRLAVITPGFTADCLETLEEIRVENAGYFSEAGGERFAAIPCLNDSEEGMAVIEAVVRRELGGWTE